MSVADGPEVELNGVAVNVTIPEDLRWTDERRGEAHVLTSLTVRLLPDGHLAVKAYGRPVAGGRWPVAGGRGGYVSFPVPTDRPELAALVDAAADRAASLWAAHRGLA